MEFFVQFYYLCLFANLAPRVVSLALPPARKYRGCGCEQINSAPRLRPRLNFVNRKIQVYLENYLKRTNYEIATISVCDLQDKLSAKERDALTRVSAKTKVNIKRADKAGKHHSRFRCSGGKSQRTMIKGVTKDSTPLCTNQQQLQRLIKSNFQWLDNSQNPPGMPESRNFYALT